MEALKIYRAFVEIEKHWNNDNTELWVMPNFRELEECLSIFHVNTFEDNGITAHIKGGYLVFDLVPLCERIDLDAKEIFPPEDLEK